MSINLLNFPEFILKDMLDLLKIHEIIDFSFVSKKAQTLVKKLTNCQKRNIEIIITIVKNEQTIKVKEEWGSVQYIFYNRKLKKSMTWHRGKKYREFHKSAFKRGSRFATVLTHIFWLFEKAPRHIELNVNSNEHIVRSLANFTIDTIKLHGALEQEHFALWKKFFSVQNELRIRERMDFDVAVRDGEVLKRFNTSKFERRRFVVNEVSVEKGAWFDGQMLRTFVCNANTLFDAPLGGAECNVLIKRWLRMEIELTHMDIRPPRPRFDLNYDDVLRGIEHKPWDPTERGEYFPWAKCSLDLSEARDIVRSDGKLASIRVYSITNIFFFIVWGDDKFPDLSNSDFVF